VIYLIYLSEATGLIQAEVETSTKLWSDSDSDSEPKTIRKLLALGINEEWGLTVLWLLEQGNPQWLSPKSTPGMAICMFHVICVDPWFIWVALSIRVRIVNYKL